MKTFFGFTTGLLAGIFGGIMFTAMMFQEDEDLRDYMNTSVKKSD
jgi:hypothetical protein